MESKEAQDIRECQESQNITMCERCSDYWLCILRTSYIKADKEQTHTKKVLLEELSEIFPNTDVYKKTNFSLINLSSFEFSLLRLSIRKRLGIFIEQSWISKDVTIENLASLINSNRK
jgi:hypothetical protein